MQLNVPRVLNQALFERLSSHFANTQNITLSLDADLSVDEIRDLVLFLLRQEPGDLRNLLLADLVEYQNFPADLIEDVFYKGDISCRVAISLRDDLSPHLEELCAHAAEADVRNHYASRKAYRKR